MRLFRPLAFFLFGATVLVFSGCASSGPTNSGPRAESSIPWNRPAKWEGPGVLGGGMPGAQ